MMRRVSNAARWTRAALVVASVLATRLASAQDGAGAEGAGAAGAGEAGGQAGGAQPGGARTTTTTTQAVGVYPGGILPPPPGQPLGGGNASRSSSSRAKSAGETDHFDLLPKSDGAATIRGGKDGPVFQRTTTVRLGGGRVPNQHRVVRGDTLWDICDRYFANPYEWPRIWSMNPQVENPHWIYPGDEITLRAGGMDPSGKPQSGGGLSLVDRNRKVTPGTIFMRDKGFVDDTSDDDWGYINGSSRDKMFLSVYDRVYLRVAEGHNLKIGQSYTLFRPLRKVERGKVVQLQGTAKIVQFNPGSRIAEAEIIEALDVIERGARFGPIPRRFDVVPPKRNKTKLESTIIATIHPHNFVGQNQIVFINRGKEDGLVPGNRLFIVRNGDAWKRSLATSSAAKRIALESDSPADIESVPTPRDEEALPEHIVGELRVLRLRKKTATCVVSRSTSEIEIGDKAVARKGY